MVCLFDEIFYINCILKTLIYMLCSACYFSSSHKATTIFLSGGGGGGWDFHCARKNLYITFLSQIFFSHEKESKNFFSYHVEQKYIFP